MALIAHRGTPRSIHDSVRLDDAGGMRDPDAVLESDIDSPLPSAPQQPQLRVPSRAEAAPTASGTSSALAVTAAATLAGIASAALQRRVKSMPAPHSMPHRPAAAHSTRSAPVRSSAALGVSRPPLSPVKTRSVAELGSGAAARPGHVAGASSLLPARGCASQQC